MDLLPFFFFKQWTFIKRRESPFAGLCAEFNYSFNIKKWWKVRYKPARAHSMRYVRFPQLVLKKVLKYQIPDSEKFRQEER